MAQRHDGVVQLDLTEGCEVTHTQSGYHVFINGAPIGSVGSAFGKWFYLPLGIRSGIFAHSKQDALNRLIENAKR